MRRTGIIRIISFTVLSLITAATCAELRPAFWNIQHLGWNNDKSYEAVARVSAQFDLLAIQEVMNTDGLALLVETLERKTGEGWESLNSEPLGENTYREKYAFIWREDAVEYLDGAVTYIDERDRFVREPFSARFRVKSTGMTFVGATVHIVYGDTISDRTPEIRALRHYWDWLEEVYPEDADRCMLFSVSPSPSFAGGGCGGTE